MHRTSVDINVIEFHCLVVSGYARHGVTPELRRLENICFINRGYLAPALQRNFKSNARDSLNLCRGVTHRVNRSIIIDKSSRLTKIKSAKQFSDYQNIRAANHF